MDKLNHTKKLLAQLHGKELTFGCSGGVDSMVLLYLLYQEGLKPYIIHVNYQKRGKESDLDAQLVARTCIKYGFPYEVINYRSNIDSGNFQENARIYRRKLLQWRGSHEVEHVSLFGHHADDQIETFFMNLARKSGIMGLAAMEEQSSKYMRPLFYWYKTEIYDFARDHAIEWREDASNEENDYVRNQWRNVLIPEMEKAVPTIKTSVFYLTEVFQQTQQHIESKIGPVVASIHESSQLSLELAKILPQDYLFELWRQLKQDPSHFESFTKLLDSQKGKYVTLKGMFKKVIHEGEYLHFERHEQYKRTYKFETTEITTLPESFDKWTLYLDATKINGQLILRKWQQGDRLSPIGMNGSKLVSDVITDAKVPNHQRQDVHVLTDDKHILWIPGVKVGKFALANNSTSNILQVKVRKMR